MEKAICVIGIGNPLRHDDGIGIVLLDFLKQYQKEFPASVSYVDGGTGGMNVLHLFSDYDIILIIDAVEFKGKPGAWVFFSSEEVISQKHLIVNSTHGSDIFQIISIARQLGESPTHVFFFGIEPQDVSFGEGLSESVNNHLPEIQKQLKEKLHWMINTFLF